MFFTFGRLELTSITQQKLNYPAKQEPRAKFLKLLRKNLGKYAGKH